VPGLFLNPFRLLNPKTAIEKFFQNGKPGLGRFAPCVATSTGNAVFGLKSHRHPWSQIASAENLLAAVRAAMLGKRSRPPAGRLAGEDSPARPLHVFPNLMRLRDRFVKQAFERSTKSLNGCGKMVGAW